MSGISNLQSIIARLRPVVVPGEFVFITRPFGKYGDGGDLRPIAAVAESEGLSLIVSKANADLASERYDGVFAMITLRVRSDLQAVGLTQVVAGTLADRGISANVVAGFHHDHVFVPSLRVGDAMKTLADLMASENGGRTH